MFVEQANDKICFIEMFRHRDCHAVCAFIAVTRGGGRAHVPAVHAEVPAGRGETWRWMSAAAGASGDRVLASEFNAH